MVAGVISWTGASLIPGLNAAQVLDITGDCIVPVLLGGLTVRQRGDPLMVAVNVIVTLASALFPQLKFTGWVVGQAWALLMEIVPFFVSPYGIAVLAGAALAAVAYRLFQYWRTNGELDALKKRGIETFVCADIKGDFVQWVAKSTNARDPIVLLEAVVREAGRLSADIEKAGQDPERISQVKEMWKTLLKEAKARSAERKVHAVDE